MAAARYGFLRRPVWIGGALLAVAAATLFVGLGVWQLDRHDQRRTFNAAVEAAGEGAPEPVAALAAGEAAEYHPAEVAGKYLPGTTVLLQNRSHRGRSGYHVISALAAEGGAVVAVDRGWVPLEVIDDPAGVPPPPAGEVVVAGRLREGRSGATVTPASGGLPDRLNSVDLAELAALWQAEVAPVYVELIGQTPPLVAGDPLPVDPPDLAAGPHLAYAFQWFAFAVIAVAGFVVLAVRTGRRPPPVDRPDAAVAGPAPLG